MTSAPSRRLLIAGAGLGAAGLIVLAALVALAPVTNGDNYCGRLYFDTIRSNACSSTMAARSVWVLALTGGSAALWTAVLLAVRRLRWLLVTVLGVAALGGVVVAFNRLLEPTPNTVFCGSVLNRHHSSEPAREARCNALLAPYGRAAVKAFVVSAVTGSAAIGVAIWPRPEDG